jgi:hypothetical protein
VVGFYFQFHLISGFAFNARNVFVDKEWIVDRAASQRTLVLWVVCPVQCATHRQHPWLQRLDTETVHGPIFFDRSAPLDSESSLFECAISETIDVTKLLALLVAGGDTPSSSLLILS